VNELQLEVQYFEMERTETRGSPTFYNLTPRLDEQAQGPDELETWYNIVPVQIPRQERDLSQSPRIDQLGPTMNQSAADETETNPRGMPSNPLAVQNSAGLQIGATSEPARIDAVSSGPTLTEIPSGAPVLLPTDSDVFSFLAGASPSARATETGGAQPTVQGPAELAVPSLPVLGDRATAPPGLGESPVPTSTLTQQELGMILKAIQTFLSDFPKLELADVATRATRLIAWKSAVQQALIPIGAPVVAWWNWCVAQANATYKIFLTTPLINRESVVPTSTMPMIWSQLDAWLRPKLLESIPGVIRDWVAMRGRQNQIDQTHVILFWVLKQFGPGSAEEQVAIETNIRNPHVCTQPRAAQIELMRWKENVRRLAELNIAPPPLLITYRALESTSA